MMWTCCTAPLTVTMRRSAGVLTVVVAALVGALLVLPTGGEIPILLGLAAAGASAGVLVS